LQNPGIGSANVRPPFRACRAVNSAVSRRGATSPPSDEKRPRTGAEARWAFRLVLPSVSKLTASSVFDGGLCRRAASRRAGYRGSQTPTRHNPEFGISRRSWGAMPGTPAAAAYPCTDCHTTFSPRRVGYASSVHHSEHATVGNTRRGTPGVDRYFDQVGRGLSGRRYVSRRCPQCTSARPAAEYGSSSELPLRTAATRSQEVGRGSPDREAPS